MHREGGTSPKVEKRPWIRAYPKELDWNMAIEERPVISLLDDAVIRYPNNPFFDFFGKTDSYSDVAALVARAAVGLQRLGARKGTRVGLFLPNCPYYVICFLPPYA